MGDTDVHHPSSSSTIMIIIGDPVIELFHGYTYTGHPLAMAAGMATLDTYQEEGG